MLDPSDPKGREQARAVAAAAQLGFGAGAPVVLCSLAGYFLEQRRPAGGLWVIGGVLIGIAAGVVAAYRIVAPLLNDGNHDKK